MIYLLHVLVNPFTLYIQTIFYSQRIDMGRNINLLLAFIHIVFYLYD